MARRSSSRKSRASRPGSRRSHRQDTLTLSSKRSSVDSSPGKIDYHNFLDGLPTQLDASAGDMSKPRFASRRQTIAQPVSRFFDLPLIFAGSPIKVKPEISEPIAPPIPPFTKARPLSLSDPFISKKPDLHPLRMHPMPNAQHKPAKQVEAKVESPLQKPKSFSVRSFMSRSRLASISKPKRERHELFRSTTSLNLQMMEPVKKSASLALLQVGTTNEPFPVLSISSSIQHSSIKSLAVSIKLRQGSLLASCLAVISSGSETNVISPSIVGSLQLVGQKDQEGVSYYVPLLVEGVAGGWKMTRFTVGDMVGFHVQLGMPWLADEDPVVSWTARMVKKDII